MDTPYDLNNREIDFPDPATFHDPYSATARSTVAGQTWIVTRSTRDFWKGKCNAEVSFSGSVSDGAVYTYQDLERDDVHSVTLGTRRWGVMGRGKVGKLAEWMRETDYGIEDESGEVRADWRATWAVLVVNDAQGNCEGMDLLTSILYNSDGIVEALRTVCMQEHSLVVFQPEDVIEVPSGVARGERDQDARADADKVTRTKRNVKMEEKDVVKPADSQRGSDLREGRSCWCLVM